MMGNKRLLAIGILGAAAAALAAVGAGSVFELDGNPQQDGGAGPPDDWARLYAGAANGSTEYSGLKADGAANATIFTGGGSKDDLDISKWNHKDQAGGLPDKDNIINSGAAAYNVNNDLVIYAHADRFANDGDAQFGFWFFQQRISTNANGSFNGVHVVGDVLVLANFINGGAAAQLQVLEWVGTGGNLGGGTLRELLAPSAALCTSGTLSKACGIGNASPVAAPWAYTPKSGSPGTFPPYSFFEVGINISEIFRAAGIPTPCFASFLAETRSSTSVNATLKDFVLGDFPVCEIRVTKTCSEPGVAGDGTLIQYNYRVTVQNTGFGRVHNVKVSDPLAGITNLQIAAQLDAGASAYTEGTFTTTQNPPTNTATATAALGPNEVSTLTSFTSKLCDPIPLSAQLEVKKRCAGTPPVELAVVNGQVVPKVNFEWNVCNIGMVQLTGVEVKDEVTGYSPVTLASSITLNPGACYPGPTNAAYAAGSYYAKRADNDEGTVCNAAFSDTIRATATGALGTTVTPAAATATCTLVGVCPALNLR